MRPATRSPWENEERATALPRDATDPEKSQPMTLLGGSAMAAYLSVLVCISPEPG